MKSIIIRGPLGVGKTTVAKMVAQKLGGLYISIDQVLDEHGLDQVSDGEGVPLENFLQANEIITQEAKQQGVSVIVDGNFYHKEQLDDIVKRLGDVVVFTLKAPVETCVARDALREKSYGADAARVVHMFVSRFDAGVIINTENQRPKETTKEIIDAFSLHNP